VLRVEVAPYQSRETNPWVCRGKELLTPTAPEHTATRNRTEWAVHDDADPLTWWPLCEGCAVALAYLW
jgi:hypothetical protein